MSSHDWAQLYATEVAPAMDRFAAGPPTFVWVGLGVLAVAGVALVAFGSGTVRLAGLVPLGMVAFVGFMVVTSAGRQGQPARYRVGEVASLVRQKVVESRTAGPDVGRMVYQVELRTAETAAFDADGAGEPDRTAQIETLVLSETLFGVLSEGQTAVLVSYPGAEGAVAFAVTDAGVVR